MSSRKGTTTSKEWTSCTLLRPFFVFYLDFLSALDPPPPPPSLPPPLFFSLSLSLFFSFFFCCRLPLFLSFFSSSFFFLPDFFGWYRARYKDRPVKAYTHSSRFVPLWIYLLRIVCLLYNPSHSLILMFTLEIVFIASILDVTKSSCIWMPEISQRCSKDIIWRPCDWYALKSQRWRFRWRTIVRQKSNNQLELGRRKCAPISANS